MVAIVRLSDEYQSQFDEDKAVNWFKTVEGMPYGWHNFVYTFMDTMVWLLFLLFEVILFQFLLIFISILVWQPA